MRERTKKHTVKELIEILQTYPENAIVKTRIEKPFSQGEEILTNFTITQNIYGKIIIQSVVSSG